MIHLSVNGKVTKILLESYISDQDKNTLFQVLQDFSRFDITFIDMKVISEDVFHAIYNKKDQITIATNCKVLWQYLLKLGLRNKYISPFENEAIVKEPIKAIAIGGSAGSIQNILPIVKAIPFLEIAVFVVVHILPDKKSHLSEIIQNVTRYKVCEPFNNEKIQPGHIYVAKPNLHMVISDGHIFLSDSEHVKHSRPSIDVTFKSLTYQYRASLLGILLCGYGSDGSDSLRDLQFYHSEIILQDPNDCEAKDMLHNAMKVAPKSKVLSLKQIINYIKSALAVSVDIANQMESFLENLYVASGYDFRDYDRNSLARRIELFIDQKNINNFKDFSRLVLDDQRVLQQLLSAFSINVTNFFRNPEVFKSIKQEVLPYLESSPYIRIWCAGCSRGAEPYSIAMMLDEYGLLEKSQIYATDFNEHILQEANNGIYPLNEFDEGRENYLLSDGREKFANWFEANDDFVQVKKSIRDKVIFFQHNLVSDASINEFHLIFCRNVLIYFNKDLQKRVFDLINDSLFRNSFLVLGHSETIPDSLEYNQIGNKKNKIYKKKLI